MIPDFPDWFQVFLEEQIKNTPCLTEQQDAHNYNLDSLMIAYVSLWGVIEAFSKIIVRLYEKRVNLKEIEAQLKEAENYKTTINDWSKSLSALIEQYRENIKNGMTLITASDEPKKIINIKPIKATKYSVEKKDVALMKLPSKDEFDETCLFLKIQLPGLSVLLKSKSADSIYYKTRNSIAHEGKSDIEHKNFIRIRIKPVQQAMLQIKEIMKEA